MFPGRQIKYNLQFNQNVFTPPTLDASCFLLKHQWMFEPFLIVVFESLNCPHCEKMDLQIIQSLLERVQICKICWKTEDSARHREFFWRTVLNLLFTQFTVNCSEQTRDSWTTFCMISLILLKLFTFSQILQEVPKLSHATVNDGLIIEIEKKSFKCIKSLFLYFK